MTHSSAATPELYYALKMQDLYETETHLLDVLRTMAKGKKRKPSQQPPKSWDTHLHQAKAQVQKLRQIFNDLADCFSSKKTEVKNLILMVSAAPDAEILTAGKPRVTPQTNFESEEISCFRCLKTYASLLDYHDIVIYLDDRIKALTNPVDKWQRHAA